MTGVWQLAIDKLPPHALVSLWFLTSDEGDATNYIALASTVFQTNGATIRTVTQGTTNGEIMLHSLTLTLIVQTNKVIDPKADWHLGTNELRFSFEGSYQYQLGEKRAEQYFLVPCSFDTNGRSISSLPIQSNAGRWRRVIIGYQ